MSPQIPIIQQYREVFKRHRADSIIDMDKYDRHNHPFYIARLETFTHELNGKFPLRRQSQHYFELVKKGKGIRTVGCTAFEISDNMLITVPARVAHSGQYEATKTEGFVLGFDLDFFLDKAFPRYLVENKRVLNHSAVPNLHLTPAQVDHLANILENLMEESGNQAVGCMANEIIPVRILEFLIFSDRFGAVAAMGKPEPEFNKLVFDFNILVDKHFRDQRFVNFYADALNLHPNSLNAVVKFHSGLSAKSMINKRIIEESRCLLANTSLSVKETALTLGFEDPNYFSFFFKREKGLSPLEYKQAFYLKSTA
jgi:AraC family transcriptional activator of pobA